MMSPQNLIRAGQDVCRLTGPPSGRDEGPACLISRSGFECIRLSSILEDVKDIEMSAVSLLTNDLDGPSLVVKSHVRESLL